MTTGGGKLGHRRNRGEAKPQPRVETTRQVDKVVEKPWTLTCFLYQGLHRMRESPNRKQVLAIVVQEVTHTSSTLMVVGAMMINAIAAVMASTGAWLLYVPIHIIEADVEAMVCPISSCQTAWQRSSI